MRHLAYKVVTPSRVQCCYNALGKGVIRLYPAHCITHVVNIEAGDTLETSRTERQIRLMTNSHKSQSEKLATGGGRETTAEKPDKQRGPRPTPLTGRAHVGGGSRGKSPNPTPGPCAGSREQ